jgi:hypothetical protein
MYNQLSTIFEPSLKEIFEEDIENEYLNLQRSVKSLVIYINSKDFNEGVNSKLEPYVKDLKGILVKLNHIVFNNQSEFSRYAIRDIFKKKSEFTYVPKTLARELQFKIIMSIEILNEIIKLFSEVFKTTQAIQHVYRTSQNLISIMMKMAPKSVGIAIKRFIHCRGKVISLGTPFYIVKEALFISKSNLYNMGKELEYAKLDENQSAIDTINNKIQEAEEEKSQLDNIKDTVEIISEKYKLLVNETDKITKRIEEKILKLSAEINKIEDTIVNNSRFQRRINVLI